MGKTYRNVNAGSNSVSYHSPHDRGFAKQIKARSHQIIRHNNNNKNCNDDNIEIFNCKCEKMNNHWASAYYGRIGNIPNCEGYCIEDYDYKWNKNDTSLKDTIETIIDNIVDSKDKYLIASKKQIERRGNIGRFYGHHE